jgi:hypothetical protein
MGGNAFPNLKDKILRLNTAEFASFQKEVLGRLRMMLDSNHLSRAIFSEIISYHTKPSFGDLDIIYTEFLEGCILPTPEEFKAALGAVDMVRNGPVTSFAVPCGFGLFQVDLIRVHFEEFDSAFSYFAYNDLGNLLGRIFHRAGFKLGHSGMSYVIRDEQNSSHVAKEVIVTRSWKEALEFAGYDYERWVNGFDTLEDVFRYVVSVPTANRTIFRLDETNHQARVRDRKRKTYQLFLNWVNDPSNGIPDNETIPKTVLRSQWMTKAFERFPKFKEEYETAQSQIQKVRAARSKFNGDLVRQITGLEGKELGAFIADFVQNFIVGACHTNRENWAITNSPEEIEIMIRHWHTSKSA